MPVCSRSRVSRAVRYSSQVSSRTVTLMPMEAMSLAKRRTTPVLALESEQTMKLTSMSCAEPDMYSSIPSSS